MESKTTFGNESVDELNTNENKKPKGSAQGVRVIVEFVLCGLLLAGILLSMRSTRTAFEKAEQDFADNNRSSVTTLEDGRILVSGIANGVPFEYIEDGRILPGVSIAGVRLDGMTYEEAREALLDDMQQRISGINICATVENTTLVLTSSDFNITTSRDLNEMIHEALMVGRGTESDYFSVYQERRRIANEGVDLGDYELVMDVDSMRENVGRIGEIVDKAPREPYITLLSHVGGGKPGVGVGGDASDLYTTKTVYAPNGVAMADIQFHNGQNGYVLNREDMLDKIVAAFNSGNYRAELELDLVETEPEHTAEELTASFTEIARFSTNFSGTAYRSRNVQKAAGLLHCTIFEPGVDYSYNEILGPRYESDGWLPAPGISGGREYIDSPGGGICQVSSTLYNALLRLGPEVKIVRRSHHSIPGGYIDKGLDATVSYGGPDLVWRNETGTQMLLFSYADMERRTVYEIIYGVPNEEGLTYRCWSETVEELTPPEPKRVAEPTWPTGYSKTTITARKGYKVNVYRQTYDAEGNKVGEPVLLYTDTYSPVQAEVHYGTGSPSLPIPQQ